MIFVNFKTYEQGSGQKAVELVKLLEEVATSTQVKIIPVVQALDAEMVIASTKLEIWIQHIDPITYGAHTGWTLPDEAAKIGVAGVFLNHSEHKFENLESLKNALQRCNEVNLRTLVFAKDLDELKNILELKPTYVAYEPPELIGSTTTSVAQAKPEVISQAAELSKKSGIPLVVGAGVHSQEDVRKSVELGAVGVAVATDIVKAEDPKGEVMDLIEGMK